MKKIITLLTIVFCFQQIMAQVCFGTATNFSVSNQPLSIVTADFNGDGKADLATVNGNNSGNISILIGNGTGSFAAADSFPIPSGNYYPMSLTSADFNGDNFIDLAIANEGNSAAVIVLGNGTGSFAAPISFPLGGYPFSICKADFNKDGNIDLATCSGNFNNVSVLLGTGAGSFNPVTNFTVGTVPVSIIAADFNSDGNQDLSVSNMYGNNISVLLGNGAGNFSPQDSFAIPSTSLYPSSLTSADFNGDSKADIASVICCSGNIALFNGNGNGNFTTPSTFFYSTSNPKTIINEDFNGDGKIDLASANDGFNSASVVLGTGSGSFANELSFPVGSSPTSIASADFNGDGKPDLAIANYGSNNVSVLLNCTSTPTCVASVTDSLYKDTIPLTWNLIPNYSPQVTSAVWYWGDGTSTTGLYPNHSYTVSGWYSICATVYTSCGDSASTCRNDTLYKMAINNSMVYVNVLQNLNSINQIKKYIDQILVYPNPTSDQFFIDANTTRQTNVDLFDVNGRHVFSANIMDKSNINVATLDNGIYTLIIKTADRVINKKLVIVH